MKTRKYEIRSCRRSDGALIKLSRDLDQHDQYGLTIYFEVDGRRRLVEKRMRNRDLIMDLWSFLTSA